MIPLRFIVAQSGRDPGFLWGADVRFDCDEGETAIIPAIEGGYPIDGKFSIFLDMNTEAAVLNINGSFSVIDGGSLKIQSSAPGIIGNPPKGILTVNISEPIIVSGGTLDLCFDPITVSRGVYDAYNFTDNAAIVANNGTVIIDSNLNITGDTTPLEINGAKVVLQNLYASYNHLNTTIASENAPAISVQSGSLEINGANISSEGAALDIGAAATVDMLNGNIKTGKSIEIPSGAQVSLSGGDISTDGSDPAVKVLSGASVTLGADISSSGNAAVTFAENAKFMMAGRTITVADGENYIDNNGIAALAAGANGNMNAALVLKDGTIIEGSESAAPTYVLENGVVKATVPAGGKVTGANGDVKKLPNGGTVTDGEVEPTLIPATGITLDKAELQMYIDGIEKLTATVTPENTTDTIVWSSDDETVATVDNGLVTAVGPGTATITAKAGDKEATCAVTVTTYFVPTQPGAGSSSYHVSVASAANGKVTVNPAAATAGTLVTVTATPDGGYELASLTVTTVAGQAGPLTAQGNNKYTFTMPAGNVTVTAVFQAEAPAAPTEPTAPAGWVNPYTDVAVNDWFYDAVGYASANGLMSGTSATTFSPDSPMSRAMVWTVLARAAGQTISGESWAEDARTWAIAQGVSDGTNPDGAVSREELVTMLYRYAGSPEMNVPELALIGNYPDSADVSGWAESAFAWAISKGVIEGRDGKLAAGDSITRAEAATILARFHLLTK